MRRVRYWLVPLGIALLAAVGLLGIASASVLL